MTSVFSSSWYRYRQGLTGTGTLIDMLLVARFVPVVAIDVLDTRPSRFAVHAYTHEGVGGSSFRVPIEVRVVLRSTAAPASMTWRPLSLLSSIIDCEIEHKFPLPSSFMVSLFVSVCGLGRYGLTPYDVA